VDARLGHGRLDRDVERDGLTERDLHWSPVKFGEITARL
jgi:hypothetical protein